LASLHAVNVKLREKNRLETPDLALPVERKERKRVVIMFELLLPFFVIRAKSVAMGDHQFDHLEVVNLTSLYNKTIYD
jgi:hypothetical protein